MRIGRRALLEGVGLAAALPSSLARADEGRTLIYTYDAQGEHRGVTRLIEELLRQGIRLKDIGTTQSSLEDIFVDLVRKDS